MRRFFAICFLAAVGLAYLPTLTASHPNAAGYTSSIRSTIASLIDPQAQAAPNEQNAYNSVCTLVDAYLSLDGTARTAQGKVIIAVAKQAATQTTDPAAKAFLNTVPAALADGNTAQSRAARALVRRECDAHGTRVRN